MLKYLLNLFLISSTLVLNFTILLIVSIPIFFILEIYKEEYRNLELIYASVVFLIFIFVVLRNLLHSPKDIILNQEEYNLSLENIHEIDLSSKEPLWHEKLELVKNAYLEIQEKLDISYDIDLYVVDINLLNAVAIENIKKEKAIFIFYGLLEIMDYEEIKAILTHEVSHIKNNDSFKSTLLYSFSPVLNLLINTNFKIMSFVNRFSSANAILAIFSLFATVSIFMITIIVKVLEWFSYRLNNLISRNSEYLADSLSLKTTNSGMVSALTKLSEYEDTSKKSLLNAIYNTHPSINKRIEYIERVKRV